MNQEQQNENPVLLKKIEVAQLLRIGISTFDLRRKTVWLGAFPEPLREFGRSLYWRRSDVVNFINQRANNG